MPKRTLNKKLALGLEIRQTPCKKQAVNDWRSGSRGGFRFLGENETLRAFRYGKSDTYFPLDPKPAAQLLVSCSSLWMQT